MTEIKYSTATQRQRDRLLEWLQHAPISTLEARKELDIMHPAARIQELRERGYIITTFRTYANTISATHRVSVTCFFQGVCDD